ncbi:hypothetical protein GDO81_000409 [Engystomops pustulosus]|uniref:Caspase family p10 domain-containing protein n=1 Tax=Engystomops pustulosus TaxID=76066 RepID=A0AAV7D5A0_ENGPU|nr:hypothetical protein GDO81_000409 [Engystomops pustulosus]
MFFIQKCNGKKKDLGVTLHGATEANTKVNMIPTEADFLYHYATTSGYVSWRNKKGSWFVQSLCKVLEQYWDKKELLHILTLVNRKVAIEFKSQPDAFKQLPCFVSTLTNLLYFY